jgi:hypothetical protein
LSIDVKHATRFLADLPTPRGFPRDSAPLSGEIVTGTAGFLRRYQIDRPLDFLRPHDLQVKAIWVVAAVIPKGHPNAAGFSTATLP